VPEILIDDEVWEMLKERAEPFVDTPNSVIRKLLELPAATNGSVPGAAAAEIREAIGGATGRRRSRGRRAKRRESVPRALPGTILPDDDYELPILAILDERGGRAPTREVLDELGERLRDRLMPADHEHLTSGDVRWRNRAQFARLHLIERGEMKKDSPRGLWEITDAGRDRLVVEP
jgi:Mrr N-terminal domain